MLYDYYCKFCRDTWTVVKSVDRSSVSELCPKHKSCMIKEFSVPRLNVGTFQPGFNPAFGKTFTTKQQQTDELRRIRYETGKELVEVGNDTGFSTPEVRKPDMAGAVKELRTRYYGRSN